MIILLNAAVHRERRAANLVEEEETIMGPCCMRFSG